MTMCEVGEPVERWEAALAEIAEIVAAELAADGRSAEAARELGTRIALRLGRELGGTRYYWPRGVAYERAARDAEIWSRHDGSADGPRGVRALARQHGLTEVHVWRILARQRALHRARVQLALPM